MNLYAILEPETMCGFVYPNMNFKPPENMRNRFCVEGFKYIAEQCELVKLRYMCVGRY